MDELNLSLDTMTDEEWASEMAAFMTMILAIMCYRPVHKDDK